MLGQMVLVILCLLHTTINNETLHGGVLHSNHVKPRQHACSAPHFGAHVGTPRHSAFGADRKRFSAAAAAAVVSRRRAA